MADYHPKEKKPDLPLMTRLKFSIGLFLFRFCHRRDGTINRRLMNFLDRKTPAGTTSFVGDISVSSSDIIIDPSRGLWFRLFVPNTAKKLPLIVYFHGGGFTALAPDSEGCDEFCRTVAGKVPAVVASINYRLAPEHKYPCQYEDGFDALKFINDRSDDVLPPNADVKRCFLGGDSAGGNIAHHVALMAARSSHVFDKISLAGVVAVQPFFGGEERTESELRLSKGPVLTLESADMFWRMLLPAGRDRNHPAARVFGGGENEEESVKGVEYPRSMVVVGGYDPLQDWQRRYAEGLEKCGKEVVLVEYPNAFHSFYAFKELPEFGLLMEDMKMFINKS